MTIALHCYTQATATGGRTTVSKPGSGSTALPGGAREPTTGDVFIIFGTNDDPNNGAEYDDSTNKPTGFTLIGTLGNSVIDCHVGAFYKVYGGSEPSSWEVTHSNTSSVIDSTAFCILVSGVDTSDVLSGTPVTSYDSSTPYTFTELTTAVDNSIAFCAAAYDGGDYGSFAVSGTGWSANGADIYDRASSLAASGIWAYKTVATSGGSENCVVTPTKSDGMVGIQFALRPASVGGVTIPVMWHHYNKNIGA